MRGKARTFALILMLLPGCFTANDTGPAKSSNAGGDDFGNQISTLPRGTQWAALIIPTNQTCAPDRECAFLRASISAENSTQTAAFTYSTMVVFDPQARHAEARGINLFYHSNANGARAGVTVAGEQAQVDAPAPGTDATTQPAFQWDVTSSGAHGIATRHEDEQGQYLNYTALLIIHPGSQDTEWTADFGAPLNNSKLLYGTEDIVEIYADEMPGQAGITASGLAIARDSHLATEFGRPNSFTVALFKPHAGQATPMPQLLPREARGYEQPASRNPLMCQAP